MLDALGMSTTTEAVYRAVLAHPQAGVPDLAKRLRLPERRVREALDDLSEMSLVRPAVDDPHSLHTVDLRIAADLLLARQEAALAAQQQRVEEARVAALQLTAAPSAATAASRGDSVEVLHGIDSIRDHLTSACASQRTELLVCVPISPRQVDEWGTFLPACLSVLECEGAVRALFLDSTRTAPEAIASVEQLTSRGSHIRTAPSLPGHVCIFDRRVAFVMQHSDEGGGIEALMVRVPALVGLLSAQFDTLWGTSQVLNASSPAQGPPTSRQEAEVLRLLSEGHTDEGVAKRLGVSYRTARRIASTLMSQLGARSRFQAGAIAAIRGLIRD
ncbi:LuxR C-terminal-related transcriptional regulator (plasmid) [Streptomyces sp. BHT-5-2]|uniref:helix-turn-helix transcriptional regulator n=1 Tax=Streptomyces sp. BHT-5-2 TaxID=2866715 RepID=UPI001C8E59A3|nr:helix-turn-helix transcriptional regulator [Streptomyces sp. BHT-5-2]QZL08159.1 LuxR C-terminal-related transcriptional regulator [Streptomyces sp. BHT-5-2]